MFNNLNEICLAENSYISINSNIQLLLSSDNVSVIYFNENFTSEDPLISQLNNNEIFIVSSSKAVSITKNIHIYSKLSKKLLKSISNNIFVVINLNNSYRYLKSVIDNLIVLNKYANLFNLSLSVSTNVINTIGSVISNNSIYTDDLINSLKVILNPDAKKSCEFIYDTVCEYLDLELSKNNFCDFQNDKCIASRANATAHPTMGCCYSFEYAPFFDLRLTKNVELCKHLNCKSCKTRCITCKLFTCTYLKKQNIKFDTHKILLLDCFFNKKQHLIITSNFFKTREEILDKLQEKSNMPYWAYYLLGKYRI